jgi:hypothetical protein
MTNNAITESDKNLESLCVILSRMGGKEAKRLIEAIAVRYLLHEQPQPKKEKSLAHKTPVAYLNGGFKGEVYNKDVDGDYRADDPGSHAYEHAIEHQINI